MTDNALKILLVDDDDVDREAVRRGFAKAEVPFTLIEARNGMEALRRLTGEDGVGTVARPLLILLDLNMPRMSGLEFLEHLRARPALRDHVVFVLTTSNSEDDRAAAYRHNVAGYITKAQIGTNYESLAELLHSYWSLSTPPL